MLHGIICGPLKWWYWTSGMVVLLTGAIATPGASTGTTEVMVKVMSLLLVLSWSLSLADTSATIIPALRPSSGLVLRGSVANTRSSNCIHSFNTTPTSQFPYISSTASCFTLPVLVPLLLFFLSLTYELVYCVNYYHIPITRTGALSFASSSSTRTVVELFLGGVPPSRTSTWRHMISW